MKTNNIVFDEHEVIHALKHYLPAQSPLKDFVHHNTLHAFQHLKFEDALRQAFYIFGYKVCLTLGEFRQMYAEGRINKTLVDKAILKRKPASDLAEWQNKLLHKKYKNIFSPRLGVLKSNWKRSFQIDLDSIVQPILFKLLCNYLDQGIAIWDFPLTNSTFLDAIQNLERNNYISFFKTERAKRLLLSNNLNIADLLKIVVGDEAYYEQYIYDQQFAHQGWSGMVSAIEDNPTSLLDGRKISIKELIILELLLEIDALDFQFGENIWRPLALNISIQPTPLFDKVEGHELDEVLFIWQDAFEWTYYDQVLAGILATKDAKKQVSLQPKVEGDFQALLCIDDRICSFRRYIEQVAPNSQTYGTPGFFGIEFYYQPENGKFYTKVCPAPMKPKYLIKEVGNTYKIGKEYITPPAPSRSIGKGFISQTLGITSAFKLFFNVFRPTMTPATATSFRHMDKMAMLTIDFDPTNPSENGLQIGFTHEEMANRVGAVLKSIGLVKDFAPIIYIIGHGASTVNNPHYAGYDCGACSGRAGSVNARAFSAMANKPEVRAILKTQGIDIPESSKFVGGLHDTTRDEIQFFDKDILSEEGLVAHQENKMLFRKALDMNAKERSRRFESINTNESARSIHDRIRRRSVSLFEPRPELNHATNALCIVGRRDLSKNLFLDRRSFLNSYDYKVDDQDGTYLAGILGAAAPVCGGINLEYYFSRVDNQKLGAGTKLPHNVMGLFGVANGIEGDLRPGLPSQMIEVHDPIRMLFIIEQFPEVIMKVIQRNPATYEWFKNEWVHLVAVNPETQELMYFKDEKFVEYKPLNQVLEHTVDISKLVESSEENLPVYIIDNESISY